MRIVIGCAVVVLLLPLTAFAQAEPRSRCVQNCGSTAAPQPAPGAPPSKAADTGRRSRESSLSLDEGINYYDRKDWKNAIRAFEEALEFTPGDPYIEKFLAAARSQQALKDYVAAGNRLWGKGSEKKPQIVPPPLRRGARPPVGGSPTADEVSLGGKG